MVFEIKRYFDGAIAQFTSSNRQHNNLVPLFAAGSSPAGPRGSSGTSQATMITSRCAHNVVLLYWHTLYGSTIHVVYMDTCRTGNWDYMSILQLCLQKGVMSGVMI